MITALKKKFGTPTTENSGASPPQNPCHNQLTPPNVSPRPAFPSPSDKTKKGRGGGGGKSPMRMATPAGVNVVSAELQKKFAHGVNFNMKVIIRGDRNSGKTSLWRRLQGLAFEDRYTPTQEIQVANITWNYRTYDHIVKLDIWDIVDEGVKKRQPNPFLKLDNTASPDGSSPAFEMFENAACDASIVDVYKNCNGVLLMFDVTKAWTWGYVQRELERIPSQIPVLVMANKTDLHAERQVREDECLDLLRAFQRKPPSNGRLLAPIRYTQCCMRNAQGLKFLYNFFNVPFLFLQREYLETALEANTRDLDIAQQELDLYDDNGNGRNVDNRSNKRQQTPSPLDLGEQEEDIGTPEQNIGQNTSPLSLKSQQQQQPRPITITTTTITPVQPSKPQRDTSRRIQPAVHTERKTSAGSTSSGDDNKMVDMFEEDFDSNDDELQVKLDEFRIEPTTTTTKSAVEPSEGKHFSLLDEFSCSPPKALEGLELCSGSKRKSLESTNSQIDAWFSSANTPTGEGGNFAAKSSPVHQEKHANLETQLSGGRNPLVSHFSDDDFGGSDGSEPTEISDGTPSNTYTVESSTSCSTTGFTHVTSSNKKSGQKNTDSNAKFLASSSTTLTSIPGPKTANKKEKCDGIATDTNSKTTSGKKKRKSDGKKTKKASPRIGQQSDLLVEDLDQPANLDKEYDPL